MRTLLRSGKSQVAVTLLSIGVSLGSFATFGSSAAQAASSRTVWGWGSNYFGESGSRGLGYQVNTPMVVRGLVNISAIAAGQYYSLALATDGTVWAMGDNQSGQLGTGNTTATSTPVQVPGLTDVTEIAAAPNARQSMALKGDGTVWTWGDNQAGQAGVGYVSGSPCHCLVSPTHVTGLGEVEAISAAYLHEHVVTTDGRVWGWGDNSYGELGTGDNLTHYQPVQTPGIAGAVAVSGGAYMTAALLQDGSLRTWGYNHNGELGNGTVTTTGCFCSTTPEQPLNLPPVALVRMGTQHSIAISVDGTVWTWGWNNVGQLGNGGTTSQSAPARVNGIANAETAAAGSYFDVVVREDGTVWGWGENCNGQLGTRTGINPQTNCAWSPTPVQASGVTRMAQVAAGGSHTLAIQGCRAPMGRNNDGDCQENGNDVGHHAAPASGG